MAVKKNYDKAAVSKYNHEYYEKHKKLKGRKRKLPKINGVRSTFKVSKSKSKKKMRKEIKSDFRRQTKAIKKSWNALSDGEKKNRKKEYLAKLSSIKNGLKKVIKKKKSKVVRNLFGPTSNKRLGFGTRSYVNLAEMPISKIKSENDFSKVENIINEILNNTKGSSKSKGKSKKNSKTVNASVKSTKKAVNSLTKIIKKSKKKG